MTTDKTRAAEALAPMLNAFHSIDELSLRAVWQVETYGSVERLILDFGRVSLSVFADENDDSIGIAAVNTIDVRDLGGIDISHLEQWNHLVGKSFGWGWLTINQQGYCDGLLLSFAGIVPQIVLNVIASSIKVRTIAVP